MEMLLDLANFATQAAYFAFFGAALWREHRTKTLAGLRKACQHYWTAAALTALTVVIHLVSLPYGDPWWLVLINTVTLSACVACAILTDKKRDRLVIQEMQRDVDA